MSIHLIIGPMFSGKTTELLRLAKRNVISNKKVILIKYSNDIRYNSELITTHDNINNKLVEHIITKDLNSTNKLIEDNSIQVIGIDEGQFFDNLSQFCTYWANQGVSIIVSALDGDYKQEIFENISNLIPLCEKIVKLSAICIQCGEEAYFTKRLSKEKKLELIGGKEMYVPLCRKCLNKTKKNKNVNFI